MSYVLAEMTARTQEHSLTRRTYGVIENIFPGFQRLFLSIEILFHPSGICFLLFERYCSGLDGTLSDLDSLFSHLVCIVSNLDNIVCVLDSIVSNLE
jgi:hypothetical protein